MFPPKQASTVHPEDLLHLGEVVEREFHRDPAVPVEGREGRIRAEPVADRLLRGEGAEDAAVCRPGRWAKLHLDRAPRPLRVRVVDRQARPEARSAIYEKKTPCLTDRARGVAISSRVCSNHPPDDGHAGCGPPWLFSPAAPETRMPLPRTDRLRDHANFRPHGRGIGRSGISAAKGASCLTPPPIRVLVGIISLLPRPSVGSIVQSFMTLRQRQKSPSATQR